MARLNSPEYRAALAIAQSLRAGGHAAYFAGGCVRDLLLGRTPEDFDVATSATPDVVQRMFAHTEAVGAHFGVILVIDEVDGKRVATEVATFRSDGAYSDGRRPDAVRFSADPAEDVQRRDFTINGLLLDPIAFEHGEPLPDCVFDVVGGQEDLKAGIVRAIGEPALRFAEDKLRMLRAVRFAARLGFAIEPRTLAAIRNQATAIHQVSCERTRDELTKILTEGAARRGFELMDEAGLLVQVLPELTRMKGVEQPPQFHPEGDVWVHTLMLLEHLPAGASATLAWGMLLHDVGKPATFTPPDPLRPGDRIRFNGHVEVGAAMARAILNRLRFSNEECTQILALIKHHMQFGDVRKMKQSTLKRFLRLPRFEEHLALHYADVMSSHGMLDMYEYAKENYERLGEDEIKPRLLLTGEDLIAAGYRPGPKFREMLTAAEDAQLEGAVTTRDEALRMVREQFGGTRHRSAGFLLMSSSSSKGQPDVIVIGAGIAGLAAARTLSGNGLQTLIVEARNRVGGRIDSLHTSAGAVELGAEFVHGRPPELWALIEEAGATMIERDGTMLREYGEGKLIEDEETEDGDLFAPLEQLADLPVDMSFTQWLESSDVPQEQRRALRGYVEGFNAADADRISAQSLGIQQKAEESVHGQQARHIRGGYSQLTNYLANYLRELGCEIRLECIVQAVRWSAEDVAVETSAGVFRAPRCIVALPLGVLQHANREDGVRFDPEPAALAHARRLAMGTAERFTMVFRERWWERSERASAKALRTMSFLFTPKHMPPVWWTPHPEPEALPKLIGWAGGPRAAQLSGRSAEELGNAACRELAEIFAVPERQIRDALIATHMHDWSLDPFSRGAYSYVPSGAMDAPMAMTKPEADTLFFAGEHTDITGHWGTVHAGLRSGVRAAMQILRASTLAR